MPDSTDVATQGVEALELETYSDLEASLTEEEVRFLQQKLRGIITVRRLAMADTYVLNSGPYACVIPLPGGRVLRSSPRISAANIFLMLARAYELPDPFREEELEFEELAEVLEFVADYFADKVEERIAAGLFRSYVEMEENLPFLRGGIVFAEDLRANVVLRQRVYSRFSELTWDVQENQVIRQVLLQLAGFPFHQTVGHRLSQLDAQLDEVSHGRFRASDVEGFTYTRLNADYAPIHRLCSLFLDSLSLSEELGEDSFRAFHLNMNDLFEKYVTQALDDRLMLGWGLDPQRWTYLGEEQAIPMRPDIILRHGIGDIATLDCKFKRVNPEAYLNHDYYQLLSYCTALGVSRGALIYPRSELSVEDEVPIMNTGVAIHRFSIDLAVPPKHLSTEADTLAERVFAWAAA